MSNFATQNRYVNFYTDFAFKKLFGTEANKGLLISFLNALLDGEEHIVDLTYLNPEQLGRTDSNRRAIFDVYCKNNAGERFLIEMQKTKQEYFKDRSIFYSTFPIQEQAEKGEDWDFCLNKVYTIGILDFVFDHDDNYLHHEVKLIDTRNKKVFYDKLTYVYIEMPKFKKEESELVTLFDKWLYAIKNLYRLTDRPQSLREEVFTHFFEQAEIARFSPSEVFDYRESQKYLWDLYSTNKTAENEGIVKGIAKGKAEERMRNAQLFLQQSGLSLQRIAEIMSLSEDEVAALKKQQGEE